MPARPTSRAHSRVQQGRVPEKLQGRVCQTAGRQTDYRKELSRTEKTLTQHTQGSGPGAAPHFGCGVHAPAPQLRAELKFSLWGPGKQTNKKPKAINYSEKFFCFRTEENKAQTNRWSPLRKADSPHTSTPLSQTHTGGKQHGHVRKKPPCSSQTACTQQEHTAAAGVETMQAVVFPASANKL